MIGLVSLALIRIILLAAGDTLVPEETVNDGQARRLAMVKTCHLARTATLAVAAVVLMAIHLEVLI